MTDERTQLDETEGDDMGMTDKAWWVVIRRGGRVQRMVTDVGPVDRTREYVHGTYERVHEWAYDDTRNVLTRSEQAGRIVILAGLESPVIAYRTESGWRSPASAGAIGQVAGVRR